MPSFATTFRFTEKGLKNIDDTCKRATAFQAAAQKLGAKVISQFWTLGPFDGLLIFEAPDDETATALMLQLDTLGNVQTQTARAFTATEMEKILQARSK